eukprot:COSAG01_NODE_2997_length_6741_cov_8.936917_11_plen_90_part_01
MVAQNSRALQYASAELRADREFMLAVVAQTRVSALYYASEELRADRKFMLAMVAKDSEEGWQGQYKKICEFGSVGRTLGRHFRHSDSQSF